MNFNFDQQKILSKKELVRKYCEEMKFISS